MESEDKKNPESSTGHTNELVKDIELQWPENLTVLNLSNRLITDFDETIIFPPNLINLNLSHNSLRNVPAAILNLMNIKCLDLTHNIIKYFDDTPRFCQSIEELNLSHNRLEGPPYWIWTEYTSNLAKINLSCNMNLMHSLTDEYLNELLQYKTLVSTVIIFNCGIKDNLELLGTFSRAKSIEIGSANLTSFSINHLLSVPCKGLNQCLETERLNLSNTRIYTIESNIDIYKNLVEINLSHNCISSIPSKFGCLNKLEICILSHNNIMYLPEDIVKLKKLKCLQLNSNELCMLPESLCSLSNLKSLDLYDNCLYEVANNVINIQELDLAQNYFEEPDSVEYLKRKEMLRLNILDRNDGRKYEVSPPKSEYSTSATDDEEYINYMNNCNITEQPNTNTDAECMSSPEDWDSDEYWVPRYYQRDKYSQSPWLHYVKQKMQEGNFCPMDLHAVPIADKVCYEKMCNPKIWPIVEGQFDDLSSEGSLDS